MELNACQITKYHTCATICSKVYNKLKEMINKESERNIKKLCEYGNNLILQELSQIYKKEKNKNIGFPVNISLNNCLGNYIEDVIIDENDIIKIELGVNISGCISIFAETFSIIPNINLKKYTKFLDKIQNSLLKMIKDKETGDEIRIFIESKCTEINVFPVENCISYQSDIDYLKTHDSKYFIMNYKKYYDNNEYLILENINYEFEENDVYNINLTIIPDNDDDHQEDTVIYNTDEKSYIYTLTDNTYGLKLKTSRDFYNEIKKNHYFNPFEIQKYKYKNFSSGIKECEKNNLLNVFPVKYTKYKTTNKKDTLKDGPLVITKKFTIIVGKDKSKLLNY